MRGKRLLHLMCHIGLDTLSWARRGAVVTGLDFSQAALDTAASLAGQAGIGSARFVAAEIGDAGRALAAETLNIVYTGTGVTQWIPDIGAWARTVAALVTPGGFFYIADYHPFPDSFNIVDGEVRCLRHGYLDHGPWVEQAAGSYTGPAQTSADAAISGTTTSAASSTRWPPPACASSSCTNTTSPTPRSPASNKAKTACGASPQTGSRSP